MIGGKLVKVCGMTQPGNIREVESIGIDLMGFIFYAKSPRYVAALPDYLPTSVRRVGVFVNENIDTMIDKASEFKLNFIQLHGHESVETCIALRNSGLKVIKAMSVAEPDDLKAASQYAYCCDYLLFDTKCKGYGGSGCSFDWSILDGYTLPTPFLLSGGIGMESIEELKRFSHPMLAGYDLNSKFETQPGVKSAELLRDFLSKLVE